MVSRRFEGTGRGGAPACRAEPRRGLTRGSRVLLDQGTPAPLRRALAGHSVSAYEEGWDKLKNGELLAAADCSFDVFVTTDQNLRYQQNLAGRRLAILVLPTTSWPRLQTHATAIARVVVALRPGELQEWSFPD